MISETLIAVIVFGLMGAVCIVGYVTTSRRSDRREVRVADHDRHPETRRTS